jgi:hypothetical protein
MKKKVDDDDEFIWKECHARASLFLMTTFFTLPFLVEKCSVGLRSRQGQRQERRTLQEHLSSYAISVVVRGSERKIHFSRKERQSTMRENKVLTSIAEEN